MNIIFEILHKIKMDYSEIYDNWRNLNEEHLLKYPDNDKFIQAIRLLLFRYYTIYHEILLNKII